MPAVYDEQGNEVGPGGGGYLVLKKPWPAMLRGIFGDDQRYKETYWSKYEDIYLAGDGARIDRDGDFWLLGRIDDVMNVSGHRISTIEVESALVDHQEVAEAAVCSRADPVTGEAIVAYVTLKGGGEGSVEKLEELRNHVAQKIGPIAKPANIVFTPGAAEDAQRQDHAPPAAGRRERPPARRHDDARRPDRGRRDREARDRREGARGRGLRREGSLRGLPLTLPLQEARCCTGCSSCRSVGSRVSRV